MPLRLRVVSYWYLYDTKVCTKGMPIIVILLNVQYPIPHQNEIENCIMRT
jgi:hypothetical protein